MIGVKGTKWNLMFLWLHNLQKFTELIFYINFFFPFCSMSTLQVHELTGEKLKIREVVQIDIANDPIAPADYKEKEDPTK